MQVQENRDGLLSCRSSSRHISDFQASLHFLVGCYLFGLLREKHFYKINGGMENTADPPKESRIQHLINKHPWSIFSSSYMGNLLNILPECWPFMSFSEDIIWNISSLIISTWFGGFRFEMDGKFLKCHGSFEVAVQGHQLTWTGVSRLLATKQCALHNVLTELHGQ